MSGPKADEGHANSNDDTEAFGDLVTFYGSQAVSHGGLSVGSAIALLTLLQVRSSLDVWVFELLLFFVVAGGVYVGFRILWYGSLSGILMNTLKGQYDEFLDSFTAGNYRNRDFVPHARANRYVDYRLRSSMCSYRREAWRIVYVDKWIVRMISALTATVFVIASLWTFYGVEIPLMQLGIWIRSCFCFWTYSCR